MVRLKANNCIRLQTLKKISIPYGAIKSVGVLLAKVVINTFQFLMVRLKVISSFINFSISILFQFLMVRLKDTLISSYLSQKKPFQFLMVRLKEKKDKKQ